MYIVYKTVNKINNKIYIGVHRIGDIDDIDDGYLGSGEILTKAIKKYGLENFSRKIIKICDYKEEAYNLEKELVNKDFISRKDTYNIRLGGFGGNGGREVNRKISSTLTGRKRPRYWIKNQQKKRVETMYNRHGENAFCTFTGKNHKNKSKIKQSKKMKGRFIGKNNSQYGTCWIYSLENKRNKKIKKEELNIWLDKGWIKGRKINF